MWPSNIAKPLRRPPIKRSADDSEDWAQKSFEDMRSRQPMFRMPNWMSEDDDMSNLTSRMSQAPHFATMGNRNQPRGGPWRERRHSGGSAMSGTSEDDSVDSSHRQDQPPPMSIPIRIEAEAPPGMMPYPPAPVPQQATSPDTKLGWSVPQNNAQQPEEPPLMCTGQLRKQPHYASRTSPSVDTLGQDEVSRDARCASAPPSMIDPINPHNKFISKNKVTPQNSHEKIGFKNSPVFNNVPKPFVSMNPSQKNTPPIQEEQPSDLQTSSNVHQQQPYNNDRQQQPYNNDRQQQFPDENTYQPHQQQPQHEQQPQPQYQQQQPQYQQQQPQYQQEQPQYQQQPQYPPEFSDPQQQREGQKSSIIRNIPIFIEGRDKGFVNERNTGTPPPKQSPREQQQRQQSQWDQSNQSPKQNQGQGHWDQQPSHWDEFQNPQWDNSFRKKTSFGFPSDPFFDFPQSQKSTFQQDPHFQRQPDPRQQQSQRQASPPKQTQRQPSPPKETQRQPSPPKQTQRQPTPPKETPTVEEAQIPPVQSPVNVKMEKIITIGNSLAEYFERAKHFQGVKTDKEYLFLDEMLTRGLIQLDNIDPDGRDDIRQARRSIIKPINDTLMNLEKIASKKIETSPAENQVDNTPPKNDAEKKELKSNIEDPGPSTTIDASVSDENVTSENTISEQIPSAPVDSQTKEDNSSAENETKL